MVSVGDATPDSTVPLTDIDGGIELPTLSENLDDAPVVLVFSPAVFTETCTTEMCTFRDQTANFEDVSATVHGISIDTPFTSTELTEQDGPDFGPISDTDRELVDAYGVAMDFTDLGVGRATKYTVLVVDGDGEATHAWVSDNLGVEPDYEAVEATAGELEAPSETTQSRGTA